MILPSFIERDPDGMIAVPPDSALMVDLALLFEHFMPAFSRKWNVSAGACIASACVVSDTLRRLGYKSEPLPVTFIAENRRLTRQSPKRTSMLVIGDPEDVYVPGRFRGHVVSMVESDDKTFIVDASLGQAQRDYLPGLPDFLAVPFRPTAGAAYKGLRNVLLAGFVDRQEDITVAYHLLATPDRNEWRVAPDADPKKRKVIVTKLADKIRKGRRPLMRAIEERGRAEVLGSVLPASRHEIYG